MSRRRPRLLFIKLKHFGDVLLLTPTLAAVRAACPDAHITVVLRAGTETMLEGCPHVDEILVTAPPEARHRTSRRLLAECRLLLSLRAQPGYDYVFELSDGDRGRWLGALCRARVRCTSSYGWSARSPWRHVYQDVSDADWNTMHRVEKDYRLVSGFLLWLLPEPAPPLVFETVPGGIPLSLPDKPVVVLHPAARWRRKTWLPERWVEVGRHFVQRGFACVISCGPEGEEKALARDLAASIGAGAFCTDGMLTWQDLARLLRKARLFVGVDTAAMHLAAACQCPVVALFGPSIEHQWRPWRARHEIVSAGGPLHQRYPEYMYDAQRRSMGDITTQDVIAACGRMLHGGPNDFG